MVGLILDATPVQFLSGFPSHKDGLNLDVILCLK